ncbi:hypothetical protein [Natronomonas sp. LN261]|uniref:hypothetical protein n=1 Tax=Natronomonas sp. LN261 TaxID=2750669 RepID=UPI0015EFA61A|nr:hypothetical protein [Natronomonas sp. LN261]
MTDTTSGTTRVWMVERTYSDDEQNLIIITYATPDGRRDFRKERALTSFTGTRRETPVSLDVDPSDLGVVEDPDRRERYAAEADRMAEKHDPGDPL